MCVRVCKYMPECSHIYVHICMHKVRCICYTHSLKIVRVYICEPLLHLVSAALRSLFLDSPYQ